MVTDPRIEMISTSDLVPYAKNSRTHSPQQVAQIAASIREFGFTNPVLVADDLTIVAGHGRVQAAQTLGMDSVPCVRLLHLDERQRKAYVIADNRLALNAGWDDDMLAIELAALREDGFDLSLLGFKDGEIDKIMEEDDPWAEDGLDMSPDLRFQIIVTCDDEAAQGELSARLEQEGYKCQVLIL